jgi:general stress protein YciG
MNHDGISLTVRETGMTVREAGKKGGDIVKSRYGPGFYAEIGRKGGESTKRRHGSEFYEEIGLKGALRLHRDAASGTGE